MILPTIGGQLPELHSNHVCYITAMIAVVTSNASATDAGSDQRRDAPAAVFATVEADCCCRAGCTCLSASMPCIYSCADLCQQHFVTCTASLFKLCSQSFSDASMVWLHAMWLDAFLYPAALHAIRHTQLCWFGLLFIFSPLSSGSEHVCLASSDLLHCTGPWLACA